VKSDAGSACDDSKPPEQRSGVLWDAYRRFQAAGMKVDAASYTTAFRAKATSAALESTLRDLVLSLPAGVLIERLITMCPQGSGRLADQDVTASLAALAVACCACGGDQACHISRLPQGQRSQCEQLQI
jgi:hypothetical protein